MGIPANIGARSRVAECQRRRTAAHNNNEELEVNRSIFARAVALALIALLPCGLLHAQGTLERIAKRNEFRIGYNPDMRPLSYVENGEPAGYSVDICRRIAAAVKEQLKLPDMKITYVPVSLEERFDAVQKGNIDIECGSTTITLSRQEKVDFTLMTFVTGATVISMAKKKIPNMRALAGKRVAVMPKTTTKTALEEYLKTNLIDAKIVDVADAGEGLTKLQAGAVDAYAGDQIVLVGDALKVQDATPNVGFSFVDELISYEPYGLMVQRNDADFRLVANRAIAQIFRTGQFAQLYQRWIGSIGLKPPPMLLALYQSQALPE
jgi:ABC-type amino acid transport substrate-binding protein